MINEVEQLIKMSKIAVERIEEGLALGERLDVSPLRQAIFDAEQILDTLPTVDDRAKTINEIADIMYSWHIQPTIFIRLPKDLKDAILERQVKRFASNSCEANGIDP